MGLDPDVLQWDLNTRAVLRGDAIYRDTAENNLPGMLVPLALIRGVFGWRSEVLRLADLLIVLIATWQLTRLLPLAATASQRLMLAIAVLVFYLSTSEWCHGQRDVWMLLPALAALSLRRRQMSRLVIQESSWVLFAAAFAEGLLWAAAFWIKPFVAVPALACWLLSARRTWRTALDGVGVLSGGLAAGAAGVAWLMATGAWPAFAEVMFVWNREYVAHDTTEGEYWLCFAGMAYRFFPWILVHLVAVPVALRQVWRLRADPASALFAGFYLGWLVQSVCLQHLFDYVHTPPVLLGLTVVASWCVASGPVTRRTVLVVLMVCVLVRFPTSCIDRLAVWGDCVRDGSTPAMRDRLTSLAKGNWADLDRVKTFLRDQHVEDGELGCMDMATISLYDDLGVRPATRFHFVKNWVVALPRQRRAVYAELATTRQRFMVYDTERGEPISSAWSERIVFRAGRYVVFRLSGPETPRWIEAHLEKDS